MDMNLGVHRAPALSLEALTPRADLSRWTEAANMAKGPAGTPLTEPNTCMMSIFFLSLDC